MLSGKGVVGWSEGHSRRLRLGCRRPSAGSAAWSHGAGSACAGIDKGRRGLLPVIDLPRSCQFPWQKHRPRSSAAAPARLSFSCRRSALRARGGGRSVVGLSSSSRSIACALLRPMQGRGLQAGKQQLARTAGQPPPSPTASTTSIAHSTLDNRHTTFRACNCFTGVHLHRGGGWSLPDHLSCPAHAPAAADLQPALAASCLSCLSSEDASYSHSQHPASG
jgi:hypothetical protein